MAGILLTAACGAGAADFNPQDSGAGDGGGTLGTNSPCAALVASVCGSDPDAGRCQQSVECEAARLTASHEPERCSSLQGDPRYVDCATRPAQQDSACNDLVLKCCGSLSPGAGNCAMTDACENARDVATEDMDNVCHQALGDNTAFPACPQQ